MYRNIDKTMYKGLKDHDVLTEEINQLWNEFWEYSQMDQKIRIFIKNYNDLVWYKNVQKYQQEWWSITTNMYKN